MTRFPRPVVSGAGRWLGIVVLIAALAAGQGVLQVFSFGSPVRETSTLLVRILGGLGLCCVLLALLVLLVRRGDGANYHQVGLGGLAASVRALVTGLLAWTLPVIAGFGVLAL